MPDLKIWIRPRPDGIHEVQVISGEKSQVYACSQSVMADIQAVIEGRGLIIVSDSRLKYPVVE